MGVKTIGIDGYFVKGSKRGVLLSTTGKDANDGISCCGIGETKLMGLFSWTS